jgi:DNA-binding MarR family transcriptional regulator
VTTSDSQPLDDVVILLVRAAGSAMRLANAALEPYGLLADSERGIPQRQIGALLGLDPSAVVALVDDLERRSLVRRRADPEDRRTRLVRLTSTGRRLLAQATIAARQVQEQTIAALPDADRARFVRMLQAIVLP